MEETASPSSLLNHLFHRWPVGLSSFGVPNRTDCSQLSSQATFASLNVDVTVNMCDSCLTFYSYLLQKVKVAAFFF